MNSAAWLVMDGNLNSSYLTCKVGIFPGFRNLHRCLDKLLQAFVVDVR